MADAMTCDHADWEFGPVVTPVPGSSSDQARRYYTVELGVQCAACGERLVFEGLQAAHEQLAHLPVTALDAGTIVRLRAYVHPQARAQRRQWMRVPAPPAPASGEDAPPAPWEAQP